MEYLVIVCSSVLFTLLLCLLVRRYFPRFGLLDHPQRYGLKRAPIPYSAGLIYGVVFLSFFSIIHPHNFQFWGLFTGLIVLLGMSFIDDRLKTVPALLRFGVQTTVAVIIALSGTAIQVISNPFGGEPFNLMQGIISLPLPPPFNTIALVSIIFTVLWIVFFMNALNWLDGVEGQLTGVSCISFLIIFALSLFLSLRSGVPVHEIENARLVAQLAIVGFGMTLIFWWFDFPPPKMLMGDSGSMFLGSVLAILALLSGSKVATTFLVLGFPLLDAILVILRRILQGRLPWRGDYTHFHHRLLKCGLNKRQVILIVCSICLIFGSSALFVGTAGKFWIMLFLILFTLAIEWWVARHEKIKDWKEE